MRTVLIGLCALVAGVLATAAVAASRAAGPPERDRQSILAMAGDYRVRFDFRETTAFAPGYKPLETKTSGGYEAIRIIEDSPGRISLQHTLVAEIQGKPYVTKHWRQDWVWQPAEVLTYEAPGLWTLRPVPVSQRAGAWSQTVWQTDDSPRYGGVGRWTYDRGVARWTSNTTRRPLARRDAIREPPYGWYEGVNRHALTPDGWVHEQDNAKVGVRDGRPATFVQEVALNTYTRFAGFPAQAADDYWMKTSDYWAAVRAAWAAEIARGRGVAVREEADMGSVTSPMLMGLADEIAEGTVTTADAVEKARRVITGEVRLAGR